MNAECQVQFDAYGDASEVNSAVVYALAVVPSATKDSVELQLSKVKEKAGGSATTRIHCKHLFHGSARAKTEWRHLDDKSVFQLCETLARKLVTEGVQFFVSHLDKRTYFTEIPLPDGSQSIKLTSEHLVVPAFHVLAGCIDAAFGWERVRFWLDPDSHRVKWGRQRRQVRTAQESMFSEVTTPGNPKKIQLERVSDPTPLMIDVADVLAYCAAQALCAQVMGNKRRFQAIQECFAPVVFPVPGSGQLVWHRATS